MLVHQRVYIYTYVPHCDVTGMIRIGGIMAKWPNLVMSNVAIEAMAQSKFGGFTQLQAMVDLSSSLR